MFHPFASEKTSFGGGWWGADCPREARMTQTLTSWWGWLAWLVGIAGSIWLAASSDRVRSTPGSSPGARRQAGGPEKEPLFVGCRPRFLDAAHPAQVVQRGSPRRHGHNQAVVPSGSPITGQRCAVTVSVSPRDQGWLAGRRPEAGQGSAMPVLSWGVLCVCVCVP